VPEADAPPAAAPVPGRSRRRGAVINLVGGYASLLLLVVQGLVLVPLYLHYLGSGTYGAWMASGDVLGWLAVLDMGAAGISAQRMAAAHGRGDHRVVGDYFGTALVVQAVLVLVLTLLGVLAAPFVPGWVRLSGAPGAELAACFAVAAVATGMGMLCNVVTALALSTQRMVFVNLAVFASSLAGLGATLGLLVAGYGLWALALGMLARSGLLLLAAGGHAAYVLRHDLRVRARVQGTIVREFLGLSAVSLLTTVGNTVAGRSDALVIALFYGPETVTLYVLTRRAAEMLTMFLARIGGAVYPGFAHLVGSGDRDRAALVAGQVARLYFWVAVPGVALYMALNRSFVTLWVGPEQFAGQLLTVLVGLNVLVVGWASLVLYVNGAAGNIARAGLAVFVEAVARMGLAVALLAAAGLAGLPAAGVVTAAVSAYVALGWLYGRLERPRGAVPLRDVAVALLLLAAGAAAGTMRWGDSWAELVAWGAGFGAVALGAVLAFEPVSRGFAGRLLGRALRRPQPMGS
jgi:O-antigen/teichoic acid export membrane protein